MALLTQAAEVDSPRLNTMKTLPRAGSDTGIACSTPLATPWPTHASGRLLASESELQGALADGPDRLAKVHRLQLVLLQERSPLQLLRGVVGKDIAEADRVSAQVRSTFASVSEELVFGGVLRRMMNGAMGVK